MATYISGIDVSAAQGTITPANWEIIASQGYRFAIVECFIGNDGAASGYAEYCAGAKAAGLITFPYLFVYPLPSNGVANRPPADQAKLHFEACQSNAAIDVEWPEPQNWAQWGCSTNQINDWLETYLETYTSLAGQKPLVYTYPSFAQSVGFSSAIGQYPLWIASYEATPTIPAPWSSWVAWQYGGGTITLPNGAKCDADYAISLDIFGQSAPSIPVVQPSVIVPNPAPTIPTSPSFWKGIAGLLKQFWG
jgi:lysozyme